MNTIPALLNCLILLAISTIHGYWAFGGRWGLANTLPEKNGKKVLNPRWFDTLTVAVSLAAMGLFYLYKIGWLPVASAVIPIWLSQYGLWMLATTFLLRAIGEFRYVGFFKRVRDSRFARLDTRFYSPLCLLLSINTFLLIASLTTP